MLQKYHFQIGMQHRQQKGHCIRDLKTQVILFRKDLRLKMTDAEISNVISRDLVDIVDQKLKLATWYSQVEATVFKARVLSKKARVANGIESF